MYRGKMYILLLVTLALALSACAEKNPVKTAQGERIRIDAQSKAAADAQVLAEEQALEAWRQARREYWSKVWAESYPVVLGSMYLVIGAGALSTISLFRTFNMGARHFVTIRTSIVPNDKQTGMRPLLFLPETKSLLHSLTYDKAFRITDTKLQLVDSMTGEHCILDTNQPARDIGLEALRQAILTWSVVFHQSKAISGPAARAIGESNFKVPQVIDLNDVKDFITEHPNAQPRFND